METSDRSTMPAKRRPPTAEEIAGRVNTVLWLLGFALYGAIGFGSFALITKFVHDPVALETAAMTLWLPAGALAWWLKNRIEDYIFSWPADDRTAGPGS